MVAIHVLGVDLAVSLTVLPSLPHSKHLASRIQGNFKTNIRMLLTPFLNRLCLKSWLHFPILLRTRHQALGTIIPGVVTKVNHGSFMQPNLLLQVKLRASMQYLPAVLQIVLITFRYYDQLRALKPLFINHILIINLATAYAKGRLRPIKLHLVLELVLHEGHKERVLGPRLEQHLVLLGAQGHVYFSEGARVLLWVRFEVDHVLETFI